jgi:hypothetical protein
MQPLRVLLEGVVDYAGLFPPAGLGMSDAVASYAEYRRGAERWMLGRFIVPVARLAEFDEAAAPYLDQRPSDHPWRLSALAGDDLPADVQLIGEFNCRHAADGAGAVVIDSFELRASTPERIAAAGRSLPGWADAFVEVPLEPDPEPLIAAIAHSGLRAKARTGGVTPDAIPAAEQVARFIAACVRHDVPFKATAGLHHPLRAEFPLTYEAAAPRATMHGYLNVFLAAALLRGGGTEADAQRLLEECDAAAFDVDATAVVWRDRRFAVQELADARALALSFGSCSFTEPVADLASLNLG